MDENGQEQQHCFTIGSTDMAVILNKNTKSIQQASPISELDFSGKCDCTLKLWSGNEYTGKSFTYKFQARKPHFLISSIWSEEPNSFSVTCKF